MNKSCFFLLLGMLVFPELTFSQTDKNAPHSHALGLSYSSFGSDNLVYFRSLVGAPGYSSDKFQTLGLVFLYGINSSFTLESGIEYAMYTVKVHPNLPPNMDDTPYRTSFQLLTVPVSVRIHFPKYVYFNCGILLESNTGTNNSVDPLTGAGALLGLGFQYDFSAGISVFVNPFLKAHNLIPLSRNSSHPRMIESGFRFGMVYILPESLKKA